MHIAVHNRPLGRDVERHYTGVVGQLPDP
jgi:hypothetical protein